MNVAEELNVRPNWNEHNYKRQPGDIRTQRASNSDSFEEVRVGRKTTRLST